MRIYFSNPFSSNPQKITTASYEKNHKQNKLMSVLDEFKFPVEQVKQQVIEKIENTDPGEISHNSSDVFAQSSTRARIYAWCMVYHAIRGFPPHKLANLERFIERRFGNKISLSGSSSERYLHEYKTAELVKSSSYQEYDLQVIRRKAIESNTNISSHQSTDSDTDKDRAASRIQIVFRLKRIWNSIIKDPKKISQLSNDNLANDMFGAHIATIRPETAQNRSKHGYVSNDPTGIHYFRDSNSRPTVESNMLPEHLRVNIFSNQTGTTLTRWQESIANTKNDRTSQKKMTEGEQILSKYAHRATELLKSNEMGKLFSLAMNRHHNFSLHAEETGNMIRKVCDHDALKNLNNLPAETQLRISYNIARLHMFLTMLTTLNNNDHAKFSALLEPVVHELSMLAFEITSITQQPIITHAQFSVAMRNEFLRPGGTADIDRKNANIDLRGYPCNSGMHAHTLATDIAKQMLGINRDNFSCGYQLVGADNYFETDLPRALFLGKATRNSNIHIANGSVMDGFTKYTPGVEINSLVNQLARDNAFNNNQHNVIILDTTSSDHKRLKLDSKTQGLINRGLLTIILWRSGQKMGLLGTDQAQFGSVGVLSSKSNLEKLNELDNDAEKDIIKLDMQIGSLFQVCRRQYNRYSEIQFMNGQTMRSVLSDSDKGKIGPFVVGLDLENVLRLYKPSRLLERDSFGFNSVTYSGQRISAGAEQNIDIKILALAIKKLVIHTNDTKTKSESLNDVVHDLNTYFSNLKIDLTHATQADIVELMSYLTLVEIVIEQKECKNSELLNLNVENILNACKLLLRVGYPDIYRKLVHKHLEGSKKFLSVVVSVKKELTQFKESLIK